MPGSCGPICDRPTMVLPGHRARRVPQGGALLRRRGCVGAGRHRRPGRPTSTRWPAACDDRTILLVGSAVSYAHGVVDPIPELGQLALERDLLLHVDGCIGGFVLPYFRRLGRDVTDFDFSVPGVTSMSMDFHKYAYCPKGASVVLYRDAVAAAPPALREGGVDRLHGDQHDVPEHQVGRRARRDLGGAELRRRRRLPGHRSSGRSTAVDAIRDGIDAMADLDVMGRPGVEPDRADQRHRERLRRGRRDAHPPLVRAAAAGVRRQPREHPPLGRRGQPAAGARAARGPGVGLCHGEGRTRRRRPTTRSSRCCTRSILRRSGRRSSTCSWPAPGIGGEGGAPEVPDRTAGINAILNVCPPELAERVLIEFFNRIYVPPTP